ncbi:Nn.00g068330.m01.CDS01 [Neocucurbitaria sp. VM-36]
MPRGKHQTIPRGDPLAGWQKQNLAAPKRNQQQVEDFPQSIYDDHPLANPTPRPKKTVPSAAPPPQRQTTVQAPPGGGGGGGSRDEGDRKKLTEKERAMCPDGDMRWPPPNSSHSKPLHLLLDEKGSKCIYYHLIYKNCAPEAKHWMLEIKSKARFFYKQKFPPRSPIKQEGRSTKQVQQEKEQVEIDDKGRARSVIITARMQRKLREISHGPRGTIWILEEENIDVWRCIEVVQKASPPHNAVNLGTIREKFEIFGVGLKGQKDHVLLLSQTITAV